MVREMLKKRSRATRRSACSTTTRASRACGFEGVRVEGTHDRPGRDPRELAARRGADRHAGRRPARAPRIVDVCRAAACRSRRCRTSTSCSTATSTSSPACARCRSRTCSAASPCSSTSPRSAATSRAAPCWSPAPAARSAPSSAARSRASSPHRLVLVDHAEDNLFEIERELRRARRPRGVVPIIADVKDTRRMAAIFEQHAPTVVFHAAAYKHVPMMEPNPVEAMRNNALATRDLAELARDAGVERFVLDLDRQGRQPDDGDGRDQGALRVGRGGRGAGRATGRASSPCASATCSARPAP